MKEEPAKPIFFLAGKIKYRCQQDVFTEINKVPVSNATTKRDYEVESKIVDDQFFVKIKLLDNILTVNPDSYAEAAKLVSDLDLIKCDNVLIQINKTDGSILKIVNHDEIIAGWQVKKSQLENAKGGFTDKKLKKDVDQFINLIDTQILIEENLIDDYKGKMLFDIYFNKFLVNSEDKLDTYETDFKSQLFEGQKTKIEIKQDIINEKPDFISVRKVSKMLSNDSSRAAELYNERYKPMIGYQFSEYKASFRERSTYHKDSNILEELNITIMEQVVNNIALNIHYTVIKID